MNYYRKKLNEAYDNSSVVSEDVVEDSMRKCIEELCFGLEINELKSCIGQLATMVKDGDTLGYGLRALFENLPEDLAAEVIYDTGISDEFHASMMIDDDDDDDDEDEYNDISENIHELLDAAHDNGIDFPEDTRSYINETIISLLNHMKK